MANEIGQAIEGTGQQEEGKVKQFFTDPKNLATMLVLGAALAQNRQGQSFGGHLGRAAVGALGFRGGLDKGIADTEAAEQEAESQQQYRTDQAASAQERNKQLGRQNDLSISRLGFDAGQAELDRANDLELQRLRNQGAAGAAGPRSVEDMLSIELFKQGLAGYQEHQLAYAKGEVTVPPDIRQYLPTLPAGMSIALEGLAGVPDTPEPTVEEAPTPKAPKPPPDPLTSTPAERRRYELAQARTTNLEGRSYGATKLPKGTEITDAAEAGFLRKKYKAFADLEDDAVIAAARATDTVLEGAMRDGETGYFALEDLYKRSMAASPGMREKFMKYYHNVRKEQRDKIPKAL